jgi:uncharacterized protein YecE (DUF72 family)
MTAEIRIGTSGWHYKHWVGGFYPPKMKPSEMFAFYTQHFNTVEINNTFYRLPSEQTVNLWRETSPTTFCFAVKASRFITHMKKLKDPDSSTKKFFSVVADRLETKLGPILFQLPPGWLVNVERLATFLESLPRGYKYVFEFRDESWLTPEVFELLRHHNVALCIHDLSNLKTPVKITSEFTYVRFHGPGRAKYTGSYSHEEVQQWADRIKSWRRNLSAIYVYFNNDVGGWAVKNAIELKTLLGLRQQSTTGTLIRS